MPDFITKKIKLNMFLQSLSSRLKFSTLLWVSIALSSIALTLVFSWKLEGGAAAINAAGSLRMQTYRIITMIQNHEPTESVTQKIIDFDTTLNTLHTGDPKRPLVLPSVDVIQEKMNIIQEQWLTSIRPTMIQASQAGDMPISLINQINVFVETINDLVLSIENVDDRYTAWLRIFQTTLIIMVLLGAWIMVVLLDSWIIRPLKNLQKGVRKIHEGEFGIQVAIASSLEFEQVGTGFNQMSQHLLKLYSNLEQEVSQKTKDIAYKNQVLLTLYNFSQYFNEQRSLEETCYGFLQRLSEIFPKIKASSIRTLDQKVQHANLIAHYNLPEPLQHEFDCGNFHSCLCGESYLSQDWVPIQLEPQSKHDPQCAYLDFKALHSIPICYKNKDVAYLTLFFEHEDDVHDTNLDLILSLCNQLGVIITNNQLIAESQQFAVLQERNLIAQGLHDSIAQSLNFLNLQTQMLAHALENKDEQQIKENLNFIQEGVKECYEDVRELLINFRTKIVKKEFDKAVDALVQRFEQQTHIQVQTIWTGHNTGPHLTSEQQLQFLFILQESLSNIRKHSQASNVIITFNNDSDYVMTIRDNGIGFDPMHVANLHGEHVGLGIMQERAKRIHAKLDIQSKIKYYTQITLTLPKFERKAT